METTPIYDKPFKTYEEQIEWLKNEYQLTVENDSFAKYALSTFSYYDLINGYKDIFMTDGRFKPDTTLKYITFFYLYDKEFQNVIFRHSLLIENSFKSKLAYVISKNFGVAQEEYLANRHYSFSYKNKIFLHKVKSDILNHSTVLNKEGERIYPQQPSKHYSENHNHIPPWVLFKNITFADAVSLFKLLKTKERQEVASLMLSYNISAQDKVAFLIPALDLIRNYRNVIAHNLKFVTYRSPKYNLPKNIISLIIKDETVFKGRKSFCDVYACLLGMYILLDHPFMHAIFLNDIGKVYKFAPMDSEQANKAFAQIRDDYFKITNVTNNIEAFINYIYSNIPLQSPFK